MTLLRYLQYTCTLSRQKCSSALATASQISQKGLIVDPAGSPPPGLVGGRLNRSGRSTRSPSEGGGGVDSAPPLAFAAQSDGPAGFEIATYSAVPKVMARRL
jgi:hypothetical protein